MSRISLAVAFITAVFAALIMSPSGRLYMACLAALVGLIPLSLGHNKLRTYSLFAIAAAAGIALEAYPDHRYVTDSYALRAKLAEVIALGSSVGAALDRHWSRVKSLPTSTEELGVALPRDKVAGFRIETKDMFAFTLSFAPVSGKRLVFIAVNADGGRTWTCAAHELEPRDRPRRCSDEYVAPGLPSAAQPGAARDASQASRP